MRKYLFSPSIIEGPSEQKAAYKINEKNLDRSKVIRSTDKIVKRLIEFGEIKSASSKKIILRKRKNNNN